jgi:hypothetical protein
MNRSARRFGSRVQEALNTQCTPDIRVPQTLASEEPAEPRAAYETFDMPEAPRGYSSYEGFKSFAHGGALSIDDIVKGLARSRAASDPTLPRPSVEPVYEKVEPIYDHIEPVGGGSAPEEPRRPSAPANVRGFTSALVEGDRAAVFSGLRQHVRGGGSPEELLSGTVFLLDDAYRARVDGTACDPEIARLTARFDTPTLEKIIAALTTAIDSSYSTGVTGAKLALTRALTVLGA